LGFDSTKSRSKKQAATGTEFSCAAISVTPRRARTGGRPVSGKVRRQSRR
jgi:hypothetical protein